MGDRMTFTKTVSESDINLFAGITGDFAPHHIDEAYASTTRFKGRIAHGILTVGIVSAAIARLVSPGAVTKGHEFKFTAPVYIGDTVTAVAEVIAVDVPRRRVTLRTTAYNQRNELLLDGTTVQVMVGRD